MNLVERVKGILLKPKNEWPKIKSESHTVAGLFTGYILILAAIPAVAGFLGYAIFGMPFGLETYTLPIGTSLMWAVVTYIMSLISVYLIAFIIDILAPTFGSSKDFVASLKVVAFSYTASWVGGIFYLIPTLSLIAVLAGIYSLILLYMGLQVVKSVPKDKMVVYFIAIIVVAIIVSWLASMVVTSIAFGGMMAAY